MNPTATAIHSMCVRQHGCYNLPAIGTCMILVKQHDTTQQTTLETLTHNYLTTATEQQHLKRLPLAENPVVSFRRNLERTAYFIARGRLIPFELLLFFHYLTACRKARKQSRSLSNLLEAYRPFIAALGQPFHT